MSLAAATLVWPLPFSGPFTVVIADPFLRFFVSRRRSHCHRHHCPSVISGQINAASAGFARRVTHAWPGSRLITHLIEVSPFSREITGASLPFKLLFLTHPTFCVSPRADPESENVDGNNDPGELFLRRDDIYIYTHEKYLT